MIKFVLGGAMDPSFKGTLDKSVSEAERAATRINAALSRRTAELERRAKDLPGGSVPRLQIENQIANNREKLAQNAHRADYKRHLERKKMIVDEARMTGETMGPDLTGEMQRQQKINAYLLRKKQIMGTTGSGMAPGFAKLIAGDNAFAPGYDGPHHVGAIGGATSAMMISVARDSLASLASGANPLTVFMQQAPQVAQAMTMMNKGMFGFVTTALKIPIGPWGIFAGIVAALAAGFVLFQLRIEAIKNSLTGMKLPDLTPGSPAKWSAQEKGAKRVADAVRDAAEAYDSVTESIARYNERLHDAQKLEKELLNIKKETALASAHTPLQKAAVEARYRKESIAMEKKHRAENLRAMQLEKDKLEESSAEKKKQADAIKAATAESAGDAENNIKNQAEAAQEFLFGKKNEDGTTKGGAADELEWLKKVQKEQSSAVGRANPMAAVRFTRFAAKYGVQDPAAAVASVQDEVDKARTRIAAYQEYEKNKKPNETLREYQERLYGQASGEAGRAATLGKKIGDQPGADKTAIADMERLAKAQDELDRKRALQSAQGRGGGQMIEWERAGGFMGGPQVAILDVSKKQLAELIKHTRLLQNASGKRSPWGGQ